MNERDFFNEQPETKRATYVCPKCRIKAEYSIRWIRRSKKKSLPPSATDEDRAKFAKSRDHLVRVDDELICQNARCSHRFEIPSFQTVVFLR
ncbi:MAG: hypothetical protein HY314_05255 [Acidobacteria bacterium]|nr:hypothetical protein [Acidobacteriota bacterium]